jgi:DNA polymerase elongation subunit (family B)
MEEVSDILDENPANVKRDDYVRTAVDNKIAGRLNKEELNLIGGFKKARELYFGDFTKSSLKPKILLFDIETAPIEAYVWDIWNQNIGINMIKQDWSVLSWSAKWLGDDAKKTMYMDNRNEKNVRNDRKLLEGIRQLLDEADIVVGHNSDKFDIKKLNARFLLNNMQPPSSYRRLDTKKLAKKHFNLTSNKLAYITDKLCTKYKKLSHSKFPGFSLWEECMNGNTEAWKEMERYNRYDTLSLEEAFLKILPWESASLFQTFMDSDIDICTCGSIHFTENGYYHTSTGKYKKYKCNNCGAEARDKKNISTNEKRAIVR